MHFDISAWKQEPAPGDPKSSEWLRAFQYVQPVFCIKAIRALHGRNNDMENIEKQPSPTFFRGDSRCNLLFVFGLNQGSYFPLFPVFVI